MSEVEESRTRRYSLEEVRRRAISQYGGIVCVSARNAGGASPKLHLPTLPDGEEPGCQVAGRESAEWLTKPIEIYPMGSKEWCEHCLVELFK